MNTLFKNNKVIPRLRSRSHPVDVLDLMESVLPQPGSRESGHRRRYFSGGYDGERIEPAESKSLTQV